MLSIAVLKERMDWTRLQCDQTLKSKVATMSPKDALKVATAILHQMDVFKNSPNHHIIFGPLL